MQTQTIRRQYDEVIAPHYDRDPQAVTTRALARAMDQLKRDLPLADGLEPLRVLDLGIGTGLFLSTLQAETAAGIEPFGLDLSEKMIDLARERVPDLTAAVDDAANFDAHFPGQMFDLICTHFMTGFVPMSVLAPKIWDRLDVGGYWSLVGGTKGGFPAIREKISQKLLDAAFGGRKLPVAEMTCNPADRAEVVETLEANGFAICDAETFQPPLHFADLEAFMTFAYRGGWLTPFIEALGLHQADAATKALLNQVFFPIDDHHVIEVVLAQKVAK